MTTKDEILEKCKKDTDKAIKRVQEILKNPHAPKKIKEENQKRVDKVLENGG